MIKANHIEKLLSKSNRAVLKCKEKHILQAYVYILQKAFRPLNSPQHDVLALVE